MLEDVTRRLCWCMISHAVILRLYETTTYVSWRKSMADTWASVSGRWSTVCETLWRVTDVCWRWSDCFNQRIIVV
ncbi:S-adenosylmethionine decarboxylase proenzyme [Fusarium oxysporum f. sp. albedinis]|nr:S-adenosylmethionine decarboxylase proenzyme [Fusarium oxysporum f. sp. albedinis]